MSAADETAPVQVTRAIRNDLLAVLFPDRPTRNIPDVGPGDGPEPEAGAGGERWAAAIATVLAEVAARRAATAGTPTNLALAALRTACEPGQPADQSPAVSDRDCVEVAAQADVLLRIGESPHHACGVLGRTAADIATMCCRAGRADLAALFSTHPASVASHKPGRGCTTRAEAPRPAQRGRGGESR